MPVNQNLCEWCWKEFQMNKAGTKRHCSETCRRKHEKRRWREGQKETKLFGHRIEFYIKLITQNPELYRNGSWYK